MCFFFFFVGSVRKNVFLEIKHSIKTKNKNWLNTKELQNFSDGACFWINGNETKITRTQKK